MEIIRVRSVQQSISRPQLRRHCPLDSLGIHFRPQAEPGEVLDLPDAHSVATEVDIGGLAAAPHALRAARLRHQQIESGFRAGIGWHMKTVHQ